MSNVEELALRLITDRLRREIYECLSVAYGGDAGLYSRISKTNALDDQNDGDGDELDEEAFEVSPGNLDAYAFVVNGFNS